MNTISERVNEDSNRYRHTKIIATLGPKTESTESLAALIEAGVDIIRLNMAHATHAWIEEIAARIRQVSIQIGREVGLMMDVKGPEIRTGTLEQPIRLELGDHIEFYTQRATSHATNIPSVAVNYEGLPADVAIGGPMLVDSGLIRLQVVDRDDSHIRARVLTPGMLGSRRHINLPGIHVRLPALTDKDLGDLQVGIRIGIDFVALSFVRDAEAVVSLRKILDDAKSPAKIIAKIEDQAGVRNSREIITAADAIMVARGDLGIEIEYHKLPLVQTELVRACRAEGKPVIIATQLLESMMTSPIPTRAEVSDVCNAVREQADAVMLSGETATGEYPLESIDVIKRILRSIEPSIDSELNGDLQLLEPKAKMLRSAAMLAQSLGESGIVVFTRSGYLAYALGALRPRGVPIFAFTDIESTFHQCMLPWGVEPFRMAFSDDPETTIVNALKTLKESRWCHVGTYLVVITNALASTKIIDTLQLRQVE
jgi:pyruvate kinase